MPFDRQPTLEGQLVRVRPLRAEDREALYRVASDPLIWEQHPDKARSTPEGFGRFFDESLSSGGALVIHDAATGALIGSSRYQGHDEAASEIEIGWTFLARSHWGGRYNADLKRIMLEHAFRQVRRVVFLIGPQNVRSQRAVQKLGAVPAGSRRDGTGRESLVFSLTRPNG